MFAVVDPFVELELAQVGDIAFLTGDKEVRVSPLKLE